MSEDKEVWVYVDGKPLCRMEAWEAEKDSDEEEDKKHWFHDPQELTLEKRIEKAKKSFVEAWKENIDKELTDRINRDVEKRIAEDRRDPIKDIDKWLKYCLEGKG